MLARSPDAPITIVSGVPRSGTSMMMRALAAGGLPVLADGVRAADDDNPRGYYELEAVKRTARDSGWLAGAGGRVVKVIAYLLPTLPVGPRYRVVFMRREVDEVLRSQRAMLARLGEGAPAAVHDNAADDAEMRRTLLAHIADTEAWLKTRAGMDVLYVSYNRLLCEPRRQMERVSRFLGGELDLDAMTAVVDPGLYRQRPSPPG